jgi:amino acid adenylation domain-containing protein
VLVPVSAASEAAVRLLAARLAPRVQDVTPHALAATLACGRTAGRQRVAVVAADREALAAALLAVGRGQGAVLRASADPPSVAFAFTGHGPQYPGMAGSLLREPAFAQVVERAARHLGREGPQLVAAFEGAAEPLSDWVLAQLAIHTLQVGLTSLWASLGVRPSAVIGHSLGEYAAAVAAGALTLEAGLELVAARASLVRAHGLPGGMAAVLAPVETVQRLIAHVSPRELAVAAINGPENTVISGTEEALVAATGVLSAAGLDVERLRIAHPSHAPTTEPALDAFEAVARGVTASAPSIPLVSNVTARAFAAGEVPDAAYWRRHLREPVRFAAGLRALEALGVTMVLELGPSATLMGMGRGAAPGLEWFGSLKRGREDRVQLLETAGALWSRGVEVDFGALYGGRPSPPAELPATPLLGERHGVPLAQQRPRGAPSREAGAAPIGGPTESPALAPAPIESPAARAAAPLSRHLDARTDRALADHQIDGSVLIAGAHQLALVAEAVLASGAAAVSLTDVEWTAPLLIAPEGTDVVVHLDAGRFSVRAAGRETCAGGYTGVARESAGEPVVYSATDQVAARRFYARLDDLGFSLRGAFRAITALSYTPGAAAARLASDYAPALMDGAVQTLGAALLAVASVPRLQVPFGVSKVYVAGLPARSASVRATVTRAHAAAPVGEVEIRDDGGALLVRMEGLVLRPYGTTDAAMAACFSAPAYPVVAPALARFEGAVRVVGDGLSADSVRALGLSIDEGASVVLACFAPGRLRESLRALAATIVALPDGARLLLVTRGAHALVGDVSPVEPDAAALLGMLRAAARELPGVELIGLDLPGVDLPGGDALDAVDGDILRAELAEAGSRERVWRGQRHDFVLAPLALAPARRPLVEGGVYVVTGGQGGVGYQLARALAAEIRGIRLVLVNRRPSDGEDDVARARRADVEALRALGAEVVVQAADVADEAQVRAVLERVGAQFGRLDGVVHAAGTIADGSLDTLDAARIAAVLAPKVDGARHLDRWTRELFPELSCFVLVSSAAGVLGSPGQANYAAANAWLDGLAHARRHAGLPALSLDWGPWGETGMVTGEVYRVALARAGLLPIDNRLGRAAFLRALEQPAAQLVFVARRQAQVMTKPKDLPQTPSTPPAREAERGLIAAYLTTLAAEALGLGSDDLDPDVAFMELGFDSIMAVRMRRRIERDTGLVLETTLLFEHPTVTALAGYLAERHGEALRGRLGVRAPAAGAPVPNVAAAVTAPGLVVPSASALMPPVVSAPAAVAAVAAVDPVAPVSPCAVAPVAASRDIAIVGVGCRLPGADTPESFFDALLRGHCASDTLPEQRRQWIEAAGLTPPAAWRGAFLADVDAFDAQHFGIDAADAVAMDPQQRLFLEVAWEAVERAGYSPESLPDRQGAVYVGVASQDYDRLASALDVGRDPRRIAGCLGSFVASRVAYALDLRGPAMAVDAACASSLVAVHQAVQSLRSGECSFAIAGGTNLTLIPEPTALFEANGNLSDDGRCRAYDARGSGYFRGEGVVAFVLRRLDDAIAAREPIVAVIRGSAVRQDGRARAGIVAPGPAGQAAAVEAALDDARCAPDTLEYLEGHGTGTALGDPLELRGLTQALERRTTRKSFVALGSVKPRVGHGEAVGGATSLLSAALSVSRGVIPPSGDVEVPTAAFDLADSPFYLVDRPRAYTGAVPTAGVHCYGMGGIDAHLVLSAPPPRTPIDDTPGERLVVITGRTPAALDAHVHRLLAWLALEPHVSLSEVALVMGRGRRHHERRLAVVASALDVLADRLQLYRWAGRDSTLAASRIHLDGRDDTTLVDDVRALGPEAEATFRAVTHGRYAQRVLHPALGEGAGPVALDALAPATRARLLSLLGRAFVQGAELRFEALATGRERRVVLPTYPFQRERFWWRARASSVAATSTGPLAARVEPPRPHAPVVPAEAAASTVVWVAPPPATAPVRPDAPRPGTTAVEHTLLRLVSRASLRAAALGPDALDTNLLELGLDSVAMVRTADLVERVFGVRLATATLFEHGTLAKLAGDITARTAADAAVQQARLAELEDNEALRSGRDPSAPFACTPLQQAYLSAALMGGGLAGRSGQIFVELHVPGEFDAPRLIAGFRTLLERHPMLRATFTADGHQRVSSEISASVVRVGSLRGRPEAEVSRALTELRATFRAGGADPLTGPLYRAEAVALDEGFRLFLAVDLLIIDVQSAFILLDEWRRAYQGEPLPPAPRLAFADYLDAAAARVDEATRDRDRAYGRGRVATFPAPPALPLVADPRTVGAVQLATASAEVDRTTWSRLERAAEAHGLTRAAFLGGALADVLSRYSTTDADFCLNLPMFDRRPVHVDVDRMVGPFSSTLLVAVPGGARAPVARARALQREIEAALEHRSFGGIELARALAQHRRSVDAIAPVVFTAALYGGQLPRWGRTETLASQTPQVWLDVQTLETADGLVVRFDHAPALLGPLLAEEMLRDYLNLLRTLAEAPLPSDSAGDALRLAAVDTLEGVVTLDDTLARRALRSPHLHAIRGDGAPLTYAALDAWANRIAHALVAAGVALGDRVAIACRRGPAQIAAAVGALRAGGVYVPLDPAQPTARLEDILRDSGARVALVDPVTPLTLGDTHSIDVESVVDFPSRPPADRRRCGDDLAYIIFTSGSSGRPKGVMISHAAALNTIDDVNRRFAVGPHDRVLGFSSLGFDLSVYDVFGAFAAGATLVILPEAELREPGRWVTRVRQQGVTVWNSVPTAMMMVAEWLHGRPAEALPTLRLVMLSGDWIPVDLPPKIRALFPQARVVSLGGATEGSIWSCIYPIGAVDPGWSSVPYGRAMTGQSFYILDESLRPVPPGVVGQLYIGGKGVAMGYWNDPEKTASSFVDGPGGLGRLYRTGDLGRWSPSGEMEFLGRADLQVKIRGFRVELSEIEAALLAHPAVASCAVVAVGEKNERELSAFFVPRAPVSMSELKRHLEARVPGYMIPQHFSELSALPLNANGKIDRARLA